MCRLNACVVCAVLLGLGAYSSSPASVIYVDSSNTGTKNGTSWATAYSDLKTAITNAASGDEIWVAAGEYNPGNNTPFQMKSGVEMYGGFDGTESDLEERDWSENVTVLTGENGNANDLSDDYDCVIHGADNSTLDGFMVTCARDNGMKNDGVSPTVRNCHFYELGTYGMWNGATDVVVDNCLFEEIGPGGGMCNDGPGDPLIVDCTFLNNTAVTCSAGLYLDSGCSGHVLGCVFIENTGPLYGGAVNVNVNLTGTPLIEDCIFVGNTADEGGAFWLGPGGNATLKNCLFIGNSAELRGGAIYTEGAEITIDGCSFVGNSVPTGSGGAIYDVNSSNEHSDPDSQTRIRECTFYGNSAGEGGAVTLDSDSIVSNCLFADNFAYVGGAISSRDRDDEPICIENCTFESQDAILGRDIYNFSLDNLLVVNSILNGNTSTPGIYNSPGSAAIVSFSNIRGSGGSTSWNSSFGTDGGGNIDSNPLFVSIPYDGGDGWKDDLSTTSTDESANNDYGILRLSPTSPCIDAGDGSAAPMFDFYFSSRYDDPATTNTGNPTPSYTDMGAIEFLPGDANGDGFVGQADLDIVLLNWGETVSPGTMGDLDGDGFVGQSDYDLVQEFWGEG